MVAMEHNDIVRLAKILALQAEIEGYKAANRIQECLSIMENSHRLPKYDESWFREKAEQLRSLADCPDHFLEQL